MFAVAQATWATLAGIPFSIQLHVNATCDGEDGPVCDPYTDTSPNSDDSGGGGDGWEHYFQPVGGQSAAAVIEEYGEANLIELTEEDAINLTFGYIRPGMNPITTEHPETETRVANVAPRTYGVPDYETVLQDRAWMAPRVAAWCRPSATIMEQLDAQWTRFVVPPSDGPSPIVLGVHMRGTDMHDAWRVEPETYFTLIDAYVAAHETCVESTACRRVVVFLATDDAGFRNRTLARYGTRLAMQDGGNIQRSDGREAIWMSRDHSRALQRGTEVMLDTLLLSRCDFLLKPNSAVSEWAIYYNPRLSHNSYTVRMGRAGHGQPMPAWMEGVLDEEQHWYDP